MGWVLEIVKMGMYVSFPVALFHYFNAPGNIDDDLAKARETYINEACGVDYYNKRREHVLEMKKIRQEAQRQAQEKAAAELAA